MKRPAPHPRSPIGTVPSGADVADVPSERIRSTATFTVGTWTVSPDSGSLKGGGERHRLPSQTMHLLELLAADPGRVLSRSFLVQELWPDTAVSESSLTRCVSELRTALGDDPREPIYIETLPKRGYRLVAPVVPTEAPEIPAPSAPASSRPDGPSSRRPFWLWLGALALVSALLVVAAQWGAAPAPVPVPGNAYAEPPDLTPPRAPTTMSAGALYRQGSAALSIWQLEDAARLLNRAAEVDATDPLIARGLAEVHFLAGRLGDARSAARRATLLAAGQPHPLQLLIEGWAAVTSMRWPEAEQKFRALEDIQSGDLGAALGLTTVLVESGRFAAARDEASRFKATRGASFRNPRIDLLTAEASLQIGDFEATANLADSILTDALGGDRTALAARALALRGQSMLRQGETTAGLSDLDRAQQLANDAGDLLARGHILLRQAAHRFTLGQFEAAQVAYAAALTIAESAADSRLEAAALGGLGLTAYAFNQKDRSNDYLDQADALLESLGDNIRLAQLRSDLALFITIERRDVASARRLLDQALEIYRGTGASQSRAETLVKAASLEVADGRMATAKERLLEAISLFRDMGDLGGLAWARHDMAFLFELEGDFAAAGKAATRALQEVRRINNPRMVAACLVRVARAEAAQGRLAEARVRLEEALEIRHQLGSGPRIDLSRFELARLALLEGHGPRAEVEALALEQSVQPGSHVWVLSLRLRLQALIHQGRTAEVRPLLPTVTVQTGEPLECCFWELVEAEVLLFEGSVDRATALAEDTSRQLADTGAWAFWAEFELFKARLDHLQSRDGAGRARLEALRTAAVDKGWGELAARCSRALAAAKTPPGSPADSPRKHGPS